MGVKVAIVGAGGMGKEHARAFASLPGVTVSGVLSRTRANAEALARQYPGAVVADSIGELYERTHAELVVVAVPELQAATVATECFEQPWTALMEKPAGHNLEEAERLASLARNKGRKAYVALNRRWYSSTRAVAAGLAAVSGTRYIRVSDQQDMASALDSGQPPEVVKNWMFANSIHVIDYLRLFGRGPVRQVKPYRPFDPSKPGLVLAHIEFESGDIGYYEGIWDGPGPWAVVVATPAKRWELRPLEQGTIQLRKERKLNPLEVHSKDTELKAGFWLQAQEAIKAAQGEATDLPSLEDGLETMKLVAQVFSLSRVH
jgi:predicted dehydrogenase